MKVKDLYQRLTELLNDRGWTLYKLAKETGADKSYYYGMKDRKSMPSIETLEKICDALEISLSDFFCFTSVVTTKHSGYLTEYEVQLIQTTRKISEDYSRARLLAYAEGIVVAQNKIDLTK